MYEVYKKHRCVSGLVLSPNAKIPCYIKANIAKPKKKNQRNPTAGIKHLREGILGLYTPKIPKGAPFFSPLSSKELTPGKQGPTLSTQQRINTLHLDYWHDGKMTSALGQGQAKPREHRTHVIDKETTSWPRDSQDLHPQLPTTQHRSWQEVNDQSFSQRGRKEISQSRREETIGEPSEKKGRFCMGVLQAEVLLHLSSVDS